MLSLVIIGSVLWSYRQPPLRPGIFFIIALIIAWHIFVHLGNLFISSSGTFFHFSRQQCLDNIPAIKCQIIKNTQWYNCSFFKRQPEVLHTWHHICAGSGRNSWMVSTRTIYWLVCQLYRLTVCTNMVFYQGQEVHGASDLAACEVQELSPAFCWASFR